MDRAVARILLGGALGRKYKLILDAYSILSLANSKGQGIQLGGWNNTGHGNIVIVTIRDERIQEYLIIEIARGTTIITF